MKAAVTAYWFDYDYFLEKKLKYKLGSQVLVTHLAI
jgi:hypothetical protein